MLTAGGVKLLDFGLAKLRDGDPVETVGNPTASLSLTEEGTVLGTVPYMSPEQVEGRDTDARTDVFALGVILYEMTAGRPPFEGRSGASVMAAILTHDPLPLAAARPGVPASVDRVVKKCLAKNPDERWQSASDLTSALMWSRDDSAWLPAPGAGTRSRPFRRAIFAAAVVAIIGAGAVWLGTNRMASGSTAVTTPRFIPITFRTGTVSAARFAPDGETVVYSAAWGGDRYGLFITRRGNPESRALNISDARLLGVSATGDLAFLGGSQEAVRLLAPWRTGTLARVAMTGGAPREMLDGVIAADWAPGGELAVIRRDRVEFPLGKTIHGANQFGYVRVSPDGQKLALADRQNIVVVDRAGNAKTLSSGWWGDMTTLAWSPSGDEVWFAADRRANEVSTWSVRAVSLAGKERVLLSSVGTALAVLDVFRDGRVLIATHVARMGCSCLTPGQSERRELSWLDGSAPEALSADGKLLLLSEMLRGAGPGGSVYLRKTDGSDAVRLGDGYGEDLSPDGKWVLTTPVRTRQHWILLPTGAGSPKTLPAGPLVGRGEANFLPDGRGVVFGGVEKDRGGRIYIQDIESGSIRAISPENVRTDALVTSDGRYVVGSSREGTFKYPIDGGAPIRLSYLTAADAPLQWSPDGSTLYVWRTDAWPPAVDRVNTATGQRVPWKTMQPADPAGVDSVIRILVTPDATADCHDYVRFLSQLFIVEGMK